MSNLLAPRSPLAHPWLADLHQDPDQAVARLWSHGVAPSPYERAELGEFVQRVISRNDGTSINALDQGLLAWLKERQQDRIEKRREFGLRSYTHDLCQAFISIYSLKLPRCADELRKQWQSYEAWLKPLTVDSSREPVLHMLRVLALCPSEDDASLLPLWMRLVLRSGTLEDGGDYPEPYLHLGLRGLGALPNAQDDSLNKRALLTALAYRAAQHFGSPRQNRALGQFETWWRDLKAPYIGKPDYWKTLESETLNALSLQEKTKDWLLGAVLGKPQVPEHRRHRPVAHEANRVPLAAPPKDLFDKAKAAIDDVRASAAQSWPKLQAVLKSQLNSAQATGDVYYYTRTLSNVGERWTRERATTPDQFADFEPYALKGIELDPSNPYMWMTWVSVLQKQQRYELVETVLWDMHRRFPEDEPSRVELARLYIYGPNKRYDEAEALLKEVAQANKKNEHSRVELANLYFIRGRLPLALELLKAFLKEPPHNPTAQEVLADLQDPSAGHKRIQKHVQDVEAQMRSQQATEGTAHAPLPAELQADLAELEKAFFSQRYGSNSSREQAQTIIEKASTNPSSSVQVLLGTRTAWGLAGHSLGAKSKQDSEPKNQLPAHLRTFSQDFPGSYAAQATAVFFAPEQVQGGWQALEKRFPHHHVQTIVLRAVQEKYKQQTLSTEAIADLQRSKADLLASLPNAQQQESHKSSQEHRSQHLLQVIDSVLEPNRPLLTSMQQAEYLLAA